MMRIYEMPASPVEVSRCFVPCMLENLSLITNLHPWATTQCVTSVRSLNDFHLDAEFTASSKSYFCRFSSSNPERSPH